jgi:MtN3 and saliva related transmembrane protein
MDLTLAIGFIAAFFTTFAFLPQSIKTLRTRNTEGISLIMYVMFVMGVVSWIIYGLQRSDIAILAANVVTLFLALPILGMLLIAKLKNPTKAKQSELLF